MCIIDPFVEQTPTGKSTLTKEDVLSIIRFFSLDQIPKISICHMVEKEYPEAIEGRQLLISVDVIESEEATEDDSIDHDGADLDEQDGSSLVGSGVTEYMEYMQKNVKSSSIFSIC